MSANKVESIFTWYFRFNGFFSIDNFTIHKDFKKRPGGGESDILAVRFAYSKEEPLNFPFLRDEHLIFPEKINFIIAEIKSSKCEINDATLKRKYGNMQYVIKCMGFTNNEELIEVAAEALYSNGIWQQDDSPYAIRIISCGCYKNELLGENFPNILQITLDEAISFLYKRFNTGCYQINRTNWDEDIQHFAKLCGQQNDIDKLKNWVLGKDNTPAARKTVVVAEGSKFQDAPQDLKYEKS